MQSPEAGPQNQDGGKADGNAQKHAKLAKIAGYARLLRTWLNPNWIMALFTVVIAGIGIVQACIYSSQLDVMRIDQRSWLGVKFVPMQPILNNPVSVQLLVNIIGRTPIKNITGEFTASYLETSTPIDFRSREELKAAGTKLSEDTPLWTKFSTGVLFPNDPITLPPFTLAEGSPTKPVPILWDTKLQERYSKGEIYIEEHGRFSYKDAAGNCHWTQFCNTITARDQGVPSKIGEACAAYNDIDSNK